MNAHKQAAGGEPSTEPGAPRPPPLVFHVPPPQKPFITFKVLMWVFGATGAFLGLITLGLMLALPSGPGLQVAAILLGNAGLQFAFAAVAAYFHATRSNARLPTPPPNARSDDPLAQALAERWRRPDKLPRWHSIRDLLLDPGLQRSDAARIVCVGPVDLPQPDAHRFEPEVLTPTRSLGRLRILAVVGLVLAAFLIVRLLRVFPVLDRVPLGSFASFYVMFVVFGGWWLWRAVLRPTYVRVAPGVVEFLRFPLFGGPPRIVEFAMVPGTTVLIFGYIGLPFTSAAASQRRVPRPPWMVLQRGDRIEHLAVALVADWRTFTDRLFQAITSTAPTPPLSRDALVG